MTKVVNFVFGSFWSQYVADFYDVFFGVLDKICILQYDLPNVWNFKLFWNFQAGGEVWRMPRISHLSNSFHIWVFLFFCVCLSWISVDMMHVPLLLPKIWKSKDVLFFSTIFFVTVSPPICLIYFLYIQNLWILVPLTLHQQYKKKIGGFSRSLDAKMSIWLCIKIQHFLWEPM